MKLSIFSIYDKAVNAYVQPFYARTKSEAVRMFSEAANDETNNLHKYASDYSLYFLGVFDDQNGGFEPVDPVRVLGAHECMVDDPFNADKELPAERPVKRFPM